MECVKKIHVVLDGDVVWLSLCRCEDRGLCQFYTEWCKKAMECVTCIHTWCWMVILFSCLCVDVKTGAFVKSTLNSVKRT